jgi:hypothetical protein
MQWRTILYTTTLTATALMLGFSAIAQPSPQPVPQGSPSSAPNMPVITGQTFLGGIAGSPAFSDPTRSVALELLQRPDVQRTLELTIRQKQALADMQAQAQADMRQRVMQNVQNLRNMTPAQRQAQSQQIAARLQQVTSGYSDELDKRMEAILTPAQVQRLHELDLQWRGPMALADHKLADKVQLTPDQSTKVNTILQEYRQAQTKAQQDALAALRSSASTQNPNDASGNPQSVRRQRIDPLAIREQMSAASREMEKVRKSEEDKVIALLTPEQQTNWQGLQGQPFAFLKDNTR